MKQQLFYALKVGLVPGMLQLKCMFLMCWLTWHSSFRSHYIFFFSQEDIQSTKEIRNALVRRVPASLRSSMAALLYRPRLMVEEAVRDPHCNKNDRKQYNNGWMMTLNILTQVDATTLMSGKVGSGIKGCLSYRELQL